MFCTSVPYHVAFHSNYQLNMPELALELLIDVEHDRAHSTVFYDADQSENELFFMKMGERPAIFGA